ncbi:MAG TPA: arginine deiminase family protein [Candidatus Angelobacter sp.]|nr:arginine deiminase family protein [Candidatus Angelobacter sp.]
MQIVSTQTEGLVALTRLLSPAILNCELTYMKRSWIDYDLAARQHLDYVRSLQRLGIDVVTLPPQPEMPDAVFVEDTALVLDEIAVISSPCAPRKHELGSMRQVLEKYREIAIIPATSKFEGGDVVGNGRRLFVGCSTRTNRDGIESLQSIVQFYGYEVVPVEISGCLHLSTAASYLGDDTFLINPQWMDCSPLSRYRLIEVPVNEPWAANVLSLGSSILVPATFPCTCDLLERLGYSVSPVDVSELLKAEAGVTCMTLIFKGLSTSMHLAPGLSSLQQTPLRSLSRLEDSLTKR